MKRPTVALALAGLTLGAGSLVACGSGTDAGSADTAGPVRLEFWYSASGVPADTLTALVDEFNETSSGITVDAIYQGSYDESMSKLTNAVQSGDLPALIQGGDTFSTYLRDTGLTVPPTEVEDTSGRTFDGSDLVPVLANYYTFDGVLSSIPIMVSQPVVLYNTALLAAAGVDPAEVPASVPELLALASQIHQATGTAGLTMFTDPWWAEQFAASEGIEYCTPDNGVGKEPASAFQYTTEAQVGIWQQVQDLVDSKAMLNTGTDGTASLTAFASGKAALMVQSSRIYGDAVQAADFEFGAWPLPIGADDGGAVPGGNSVWIVQEGHGDEVIAAASTFAQFLASAESQTRIFEETGYLPTSTTAMAALSGTVSDIQAVFLDQLEATTGSIPSAGCHTGAMGEARPLVKSALEEIIGGADPAAALEKAETGGNTAIAEYDARRG